MSEQSPGAGSAGNALTAFSDAMADAVERAGQSIVRVDGRHRQPASGIIWSSDGQDGSSFGVFGQRYSQIVPVELMHFRVE